MSRVEKWVRGFAVGALGLLLATSAAFGQAQSGNVYGTVVDNEGAALPGVTVTLSGVGAARVQVSDEQGQFRFLGLSPATYRLESALEGFSTVVFEAVVVNIGRNTTVNVTMQPAIEETITVTAESPLLDERRIQTGATIDQTELEKIPSARDPWAILQTTPGVQVDRVNVGGNESGQQSTYTGPGDDGTNSTWSIDGVEITDIGSIGSSPSYYDFDSFEEMQVTTGGSDVTVRTGGVGLNLVTKRGTNVWRGSGRYLVADDDWQSDTGFDESDLGANQPSFKQGNRIVKVEDYGAEIGGPVLKDRLWFWGSYGENEIGLLTVSDFSDLTTLETANAKINWQVSTQNSATVFWSDNSKVKIGRNAAPDRPQPTTWNQDNLASDPDLFGFFSERPTVMKLEDTHIFSSKFFVTGMYSESDGGFVLTPQGSLAFEGGINNPNQPNASLDENFVWGNTFLHYESKRPQNQYKADASYFLGGGKLNHELKFGANYREGTVESLTRWPGSGIDLNYYQYYGYAYNVVQLVRDGYPAYEVEYTNGYIQDTISSGRMTLNVGVRYDKQGGTTLSRNIQANPAAPDLLPAVRFEGGDFNFEWKTISPRLGLTYALGENRETLLRASYARFAEQLGGGPSTWANPLYPGAYVYVYYDDRNGDGHSSADEILPGILWTNGVYNPFNPAVPLVSSAVDPDLDAPISDELVLGIEHALRPEFVVGFNLTYRINSDILESERLVFDGDAHALENIGSLGREHTRDDYVLVTTRTVTLPDGTVRQVPIYGLRDGVTTRGGSLLTNGDREQEYIGASINFNKRLSNRWMMRGNFTYADWTWDIPASELEDPNQGFDGADRDGNQVLSCVGTGSGAKGNVCISSKWSYSLNGLYQVAPDRPWGFNVAAALNGRQGYAVPFNARVAGGTTGFGGTVNLAATNRPDDYRLDDVHVLDLRLEKEFKFNQFGLILGADLFNALNEGTVLQRQIRIGGTAGNVFEVLSPRIFRLGARINFN
jgi:hypothetical protein